jgi:hypothetical protein
VKLKKLLGFDENIALKDWNQVNDIYVEKTIKTFTQNDLDSGNVWYEPFSDYDKKDDCLKDLKNEPSCVDPYSSECMAIKDRYNSQCYASMTISNSFSTPDVKYDHLLFEVKSFIFSKTKYFTLTPYLTNILFGMSRFTTKKSPTRRFRKKSYISTFRTKW